jgi:uridine phosphorylase
MSLKISPMNPELAIISPQKGKRDPELPPCGILVFTPLDLDFTVNLLSNHEGRLLKIYLTDLHAGFYGNVRMVLAGPMLGAPHAVLVLEKMIALGTRRVLALGWCGSLQPSVHIGDVVIADGALSEEGTSRHYPVSVDRPGPAPYLLQHLKSVLLKKACTFYQGQVWSTDAPYRETVGKVLDYQKQGILAVDMEVAALFTVAHFRGIELAASLVVSDELHDLSWRHGFREARFRQAREILCQTVLEALSQAAFGS